MRRSPGLQYTVDGRYIHVGQNVLPLYACRQVATIHVGCKVFSVQRCPLSEVPLNMMSVCMSHET